jgi:hypothetical protein
MFPAIIFSWFLAFGYVPTQSDCVEEKLSMLNQSRIATVAEIGINADIARFSIYGSIENYQYFGDNVLFYPFRADYVAGASFRLTDNIKIIAEHECDHPVVCSPYGDFQSTYISSETKIMLRIEGGGK